MSSLSFSHSYSYYINWTDDLSHSCPHRYFTPNYTFAFAFVILKVINSKIIVFRFALISVSMAVPLADGDLTPAIFVIFVDFRGLRSKAPCLRGRNAIS